MAAIRGSPGADSLTRWDVAGACRALLGKAFIVVQPYT
jgi:drug/metabolite transporter superfamily protein YnfA